MTERSCQCLRVIVNKKSWKDDILRHFICIVINLWNALNVCFYHTLALTENMSLKDFVTAFYIKRLALLFFRVVNFCQSQHFQNLINFVPTSNTISFDISRLYISLLSCDPCIDILCSHFSGYTTSTLLPPTHRSFFCANFASSFNWFYCNKTAYPPQILILWYLTFKNVFEIIFNIKDNNLTV